MDIFYRKKQNQDSDMKNKFEELFKKSKKKHSVERVKEVKT